MSEEDRNATPPEVPSTPAPPPPIDEIPGPVAGPEEVLAERLAETAQSVTAELQDLLPEPAAQPPSQSPAEGVPALLSEQASEPGAGGAPVPEAAPPPPGEETSPPAAAAEAGTAGAPGPGPTASAESTSDDRLMAALAWFSMTLLQLPIVSVLLLVGESTKRRPFQRHHAVTSLLFYAAAVVYEVLATIVFLALGAVTLGCGYACLWVLFFVPHLIALYYALQAYNGKTIEMPVLSAFARQQGWL